MTQTAPVKDELDEVQLALEGRCLLCRENDPVHISGCPNDPATQLHKIIQEYLTWLESLPFPDATVAENTIGRSRPDSGK